MCLVLGFKPQTPNPKTPKPKLQIPNPTLQHQMTLYSMPYTLTPSPKPYTSDGGTARTRCGLTSVSLEVQTHPKPQTPNPKPQTPNSKPPTPKLQTLYSVNPKP